MNGVALEAPGLGFLCTGRWIHEESTLHKKISESICNYLDNSMCLKSRSQLGGATWPLIKTWFPR